MLLESEKHEYESLQDRPVDTIRLITLQPGFEQDQIRCSLTYAQQSDCPQYSALSYVWGTSKSDHDILVNDRVVSVKQNLFSFLQRLRHAETPMAIWVDAISINQEDSAERGHQVGLMGRIYRDAQSVFIWLGDDTHDLASCLKSQHSLQAEPIQPHRPASTAPTQRPSSRIFRKLASSLTRGRKKQSRSTGGEQEQVKAKTWDTLVDLCQREYWTRTWIVQELLLAKRRVICVGKLQVPWDDFCDLIDFCGNHRAHFTPLNAGTHKPIRFVENFIRAAETQSLRLPLSIIMERYVEQQCLDARDNVYAFLSLASDGDGIVPNYETSRLELFFQLKEKITDHVTLRRNLALPVDEIKYRAEMLGLTVHHNRENICVRCTNESDEAWNKRKYYANLHFDVAVPQDIWNETTEFPYNAKAIYDYSNNYETEVGSDTFSFTSGEILKLSSPFSPLWLVKKDDGSVGVVVPQYFILLRENSRNHQHKRTLP